MKKRTLLLMNLIVITSLLMACFGAVLKYEVLEPLGIQREENIMALPFVLMADEELAYEVSEYLQDYLNPQPEAPPGKVWATEPATEPPTEPEEVISGVTEPVEIETVPPTEAPTEPVYDPVDDTWFEGTLFIGDSRTEGLKYADCLGESAYFSSVGMTVYSVMGTKCYDEVFGYNYLGMVLTKNTFDKIFIHLGLNECGGDHDRFLKEYRTLIETVQRTQPDATVILQEIMTVSKGKALDPKFTLERINYLNEQIKLIAEEYGVHYMDTNGWLSDEEGYLLEELNRDGCHLYATGYLDWADWIRQQAAYVEIE